MKRLVCFTFGHRFRHVYNHHKLQCARCGQSWRTVVVQ